LKSSRRFDPLPDAKPKPNRESDFKLRHYLNQISIVSIRPEA
jgi:hypothetical protein